MAAKGDLALADRQILLGGTCYACAGPLSDPIAGERFCQSPECRTWVPPEERGNGTPVRPYRASEHTRPKQPARGRQGKR